MKFLTRRLKKEYYPFTQLSHPAQQLVKSILAYNLIHPIFVLFINAFLWRQSQDIQLVSLYNLAFYVFLPVGFHLNGLLWKHSLLSHARSYTLGGVSKSIAVFLLIFSTHFDIYNVFILGGLFGLCSGIYFGTRNFLSLKVTESNNRLYFSSLELVSNTITNIIVPLLVGAFIVYGTTSHRYTPIQAYYVVAMILVVISIISGWQIRAIKLPLPKIKKIMLHHPSRHWLQCRAVMMMFGLMQGTFQFLSVLMILSFIGNEGALGMVQAVSAILASIVLYGVARKVPPEKRLWIIGSSVALLIVGGLSFEMWQSAIGVFLFMTFYALAQPLLWMGINSLNLDVIDKETVKAHNDYSYLFDSELFLNIGRIIGVIIFLFYSSLFSSDLAMKMTPLLFGLAQIILLFIARSSQHKQRQAELADIQLADH